MKKIILISLFVFWSVAAVILTVGLITPEKNSSPSQSPAPSGLIDQGLLDSGGVTLTATEIARHNSISDCWMIINNKVYSLTSYFDQHPGGTSTILPYCGKDGTVGFDTKDKNRSHSQSAQNLLANYYIGDFGQVLSGAIASPSQSSQPTPSSSSSQIATPPPIATTPPVALTLAEVAKHNSASSCWMIISGKIYNFTAYISGHPGGRQMVPYCGQDGTTAFYSGPPHAHSSFADSLLTSYFLGNLNAAIIATPTPVATPAISSVPRRGEEDDDD